MLNSKKVSVVVCIKNEEKRIEDCLKGILLNEPDEVVVVDGSSSDGTVNIVKKFPVSLIESKSSNLTRDRQIGIDKAAHDIVIMIDADHRLKVGDLAGLVSDLDHFGLDIVQSQLCSFERHNFWNDAEDAAWDLTHNIPGPKKMIGVAPAVFKKHVFQFAKFDDHITSTIDDTDFIYRLSKFPEIKIGIGRTKIQQLHYSDFPIYLKKFKWYGKGDGEFCLKNPNRAPSMFYHLLIRYPIIYSVRAVIYGKAFAVPFFAMQGLTRFYGAIKFLIFR